MSKIMFLDVSKNAICILFVASTSGDRRQPCRQVVLRDQHPQYSRVTVASLERTASALRMVVHRLTRESRQEHEALRTVLEAIETRRWAGRITTQIFVAMDCDGVCSVPRLGRRQQHCLLALPLYVASTATDALVRMGDSSVLHLHQADNGFQKPGAHPGGADARSLHH